MHFNSFFKIFCLANINFVVTSIKYRVYKIHKWLYLRQLAESYPGAKKQNRKF